MKSCSNQKEVVLVDQSIQRNRINWKNRVSSTSAFCACFHQFAVCTFVVTERFAVEDLITFRDSVIVIISTQFMD